MRSTALAVLSRSRGEVRALQDLRQLKEVVRLSGVFALTMLLPIAFLALLSLSSIRSEELQFDEDLRQRADAASDQLYDDLEDVFGKFEDAAKERIRRGESPTSTLGELSPYLRAAFRYDDDGVLTGPFEMPTPADVRASPRLAPIGWHRAAAEARRLEQTDPQQAVLAWRRARERTIEPMAIGESMLGEARALYALGQDGEAEDLLARELFSDFANVRDVRGFRFPDLVMLEVGRMRLARSQGEDAVDAETSMLAGLVDTLLSRPWTVGQAGEPAVAREALTLLEGRSDPDWLARSRSRLNELQGELNWAALVADEIELVYSRIPDGEFRYVGARADSPAIWALYRSRDTTYAFSFSAVSLFEDLKASVARRNDNDAELAFTLFAAERHLPDGVLANRPLGPWLPVVTLAVQPSDAEALLASKGRRRSVRIGIVFTAVFVTCVGALWIARIIAWEVETARQRADFAANVSHELRSPITQIRLKGEALQLGLVEPGDDMQQHFDAIVRESERLSRLVDNVLDFSAIERGAKRYTLRPDDLAAVVRSSVEAARSALDAAGMELSLSLPHDLPPVQLDREAMGQVLTNLLSNALKYGADGHWVRVAVDLDDAGDAVVLEVADRGIGIAADELPRVFDDFFRSTDPAVRRTKGTGIGLAIVRYIVEAHGGTVRVDGAAGRGARFVVRLPVADIGPAT
ncbi:MAG: HAMP domain-containing sensor histidine kinase [Myxococcota bacterium]